MLMLKGEPTRTRRPSAVRLLRCPPPLTFMLGSAREDTRPLISLRLIHVHFLGIFNPLRPDPRARSGHFGNGLA
jgi:hypothetical protein